MISKLDILNFGLFSDYIWNSTIGKNETFRRLNIIYGRNYSGKTTLSRIFKCIEDACLHKNYTECGFTITMSDGRMLTHLDFECSFRIRVYNSDFVKENLSWLNNADGTIKPFTILGLKNVGLDKQIKEIEKKLGSVEGKTGLLLAFEKGQSAASTKRVEFQHTLAALEEKLRKRANVTNERYLLVNSHLRQHANR